MRCSDETSDTELTVERGFVCCSVNCVMVDDDDGGGGGGVSGSIDGNTAVECGCNNTSVPDEPVDVMENDDTDSTGGASDPLKEDGADDAAKGRGGSAIADGVGREMPHEMDNEGGVRRPPPPPPPTPATVEEDEDEEEPPGYNILPLVLPSLLPVHFNVEGAEEAVLLAKGGEQRSVGGIPTEDEVDMQEARSILCIHSVGVSVGINAGGGELEEEKEAYEDAEYDINGAGPGGNGDGEDAPGRGNSARRGWPIRCVLECPNTR